MAAFDWYQATIPHPLEDVLECLDGLADGLHLSHARGFHGFEHTAILGNDAEGPVARVMHGGSHEYPHATISGEWAQGGAELIRARFPVHSVTRLDVREDYSDEGAFDSIQAKLVVQAKAHHLKVGTAGDHLVTMKGRTVYLGATTSAVRLRLYDKRAEVLSKYASDADRLMACKGLGIPDHWARLEAQIRPEKKEAKLRFAAIEPVDALGCSRWMRAVWKDVAGLDLVPVQVGRGYRRSDDERAYRYMLAHYGGLLRRVHLELGSWDCVGLQIGEDLRER